MIGETKRVLLGIDFIGANFPSALYSLQRWSDYAKRSTRFEPVIGISTFCHKARPLPGCASLTAEQALRIIKDVSRPLRAEERSLEVLHWDTGIGELAAAELSRRGIASHPFWADFSYGGVANRLLLLANVASCAYLVRVDPGTLPPAEKPFDDVMAHHLSSMHEPGSVVSRGYMGRLALRDIFLSDGKADDQCDLVREMTGIDPLAQVTGGAMFTSRVPGIPAIPFAGSVNGPTLVWASDDGIYQTLPSARGSRKVGVIEVPRFDAVGKPKSTREYYRGVAGAVFLASVLRGETGSARSQLDGFLNRLSEMLDDKKCSQIDGNQDWRLAFTRANVAPDGFLARIDEGCDNYKILCEDWPSIAEALKAELGAAVKVAG